MPPARHIHSQWPRHARPYTSVPFPLNHFGDWRDVTPIPVISTGTFDEPALRADVRQTLDIARGCRLEIVMKDVHTLDNQPDRLARWVRIAREEAEAAVR